MDAKSGKVEIRNLTKSGIMINSLKLVIPPEGAIIRNSADGDDPDVVGLVNMGMLLVGEPRPKTTKPPAQQVEKKAEEEKNPADEEADQPFNHESTTASAGDQMGREATIMDHGQAVRTKMNPGLHNTSQPRFIDEPPAPEAKQETKSEGKKDVSAPPAEEDGGKHPAFIEIGR